MSGSHDLWSLGRLILDMAEPWNTVFPKFEIGDTLKLSSPNDWSHRASDFLRNTSTALAQDLLQVRGKFLLFVLRLMIENSMVFYETLDAKKAA